MSRLLLWVALAVVLVAGTLFVVIDTTGDDDPPAAAQGSDLNREIRDFAAGLDDDASYRPPTPVEREKVVSALRELETGKKPRVDADLGYTMRTGTDRQTGRRFGLAVNAPDQRAWGWYLIDLSAPVRLAIEVPHPNSDLHTEELGLALYQAVPGAILAVAGTHRRAEDDKGDVAHEPNSMFNAVAQDFAERGLPQIQLHGFHDDNLPDTDVVISPGAGKAGALVRRLADHLADEEFEVCRSWREECGRLEGTKNEQGREAAAQDTPFVHVEISRTIRDDREAWSALVGALANADL